MTFDELIVRRNELLELGFPHLNVTIRLDMQDGRGIQNLKYNVIQSLWLRHLPYSKAPFPPLHLLTPDECFPKKL